MKRNNMDPKFLFGVLIVLFGIVLLFEQTGIIPRLSRYFWAVVGDLWPLILIFWGAKLLLDKNSLPGMILLFLGVSFLSSNLFNWNFFSLFWPIIIIGIGLSILLQSDQKKSSTNVKEKVSSDEYVKENAIFWSTEKKSTSKGFRGGEINVVFGGVDLDLREAKVSKGGAKIHINCAFGGVDIFVPKDCRVKTDGTGIIGSWQTHLKERDINEPVLEITGGVMFGGVEIKD